MTITVERAPEQEQAIALRIPSWAATPGSRVGWTESPVEADDGWVVVRRRFVAGDIVRLTLPMAPRAHGSHPYLDATRGAIAVARGPLVYCVEQQDVEASVDDLLLTRNGSRGGDSAAGTDDAVVLELTAVSRRRRPPSSIR